MDGGREGQREKEGGGRAMGCQLLQSSAVWSLLVLEYVCYGIWGAALPLRLLDRVVGLRLKGGWDTCLQALVFFSFDAAQQ